MRSIDENARDTRKAVNRAQEGTRPAVDHVDAVGASVCDVQARATCAQPDIGVVEARLRSPGDRDEADPFEAQTLPFELAPGTLPASTSALHQA